MAPYNARVIKELVSGAILAAPRGSQTRLAEATGVNVQTVNKWAHQQTAPEMHRWPAIEQYFGWPPGHMMKRSGLRVAKTLLQINDLHLEGPPDFILEPNERVTILFVDSSDPAVEGLVASTRATAGKKAGDLDRLHDLIDTGDVVRLTLPGSDAEIYAFRDRHELAAAAEKGKATGARKAPRRKPKPRGDQ